MPPTPVRSNEIPADLATARQNAVPRRGPLFPEEIDDDTSSMDEPKAPPPVFDDIEDADAPWSPVVVE